MSLFTGKNLGVKIRKKLSVPNFIPIARCNKTVENRFASI